MNTFTIDTDNNITVHTSFKAAKENGGQIFLSADNILGLDGMTNKRMVEIYNGLDGTKPVAKFTSAAIGAKRIWDAIQHLAADLAASDKAATEDPPKTKAKAGAAAADAGEKAPNRTQTILAMLRQEGGATLQQIMTACNWQAHSVRGFISTLGKKGYAIESSKGKGGERTYRIVK